MTTPGPSSVLTPTPDTAGTAALIGALLAPFSSPAVVSVPMLLASPVDRARRRVLIANIPAASTETLILRLATTEDPMVLWALHLALDNRDVPPCLRWPRNDSTEQAEFITLLADLLWLCRRLPPGHAAKYRGWRRLFDHSPNSTAWHASAHRQYLFISARGSLSHWCAEGMNLADGDRANLMMLPTSAMRTARQRLQPAALADVEAKLIEEAQRHPDKSGTHPPHAIATRRLRMWRLFVLSGELPTLTARRWSLLTGETLTRQAIAKQAGVVVDLIRPQRRRRAARIA
jgi:hypothetical protein